MSSGRTGTFPSVPEAMRPTFDALAELTDACCQEHLNGEYDPNWSLPSKLGDHPLAWMIQVNGFILDARCLPRTVQEEAYRRGLIPYVPGDESTDAREDQS